MKEKLEKIVREAMGALGGGGNDGSTPIDISIPGESAFGHFSTNVAMRLAKACGKNPLELARELAEEISKKAPAGLFENVEAAAPGFVNFWLSKKAIREGFEKIVDDENFGSGDRMKGKLVMVEFTDSNPFKLFHIGHLMSNTIGESIARLYEASGAKVLRANYQGDVGLHIAMAVWGMKQMSAEAPASLIDKMAFLGQAYAAGFAAFEKEEDAKEAIIGINEKIYAKSDHEINELYEKGRTWSLEYFETIYKKLGVKFDHYFFEGEIGKEGADLVYSREDVFEKSDGAIVFPGEKYGMHTRVFINSKGLPTYEAKELGLNKKKFELYPLDLSVIITGNEIVDYFRVLLKVMELILPDVARRTHHLPHGMLRLASGKMSSRKGDVITADSFIDQAKAKLREFESSRVNLTPAEQEFATETIAVGAIKYSILKQNPGQDIIFDFDKSLSVEGDSGPYIQYAYARLRSILRKAGDDLQVQAEHLKADAGQLDSDVELALIRKISELPDAISQARERYTPSTIVGYVYGLASLANKFYETTLVLKAENEARRDARLVLVAVAARTIRSGLHLLGIETLEKI